MFFPPDTNAKRRRLLCVLYALLVLHFVTNNDINRVVLFVVVCKLLSTSLSTYNHIMIILPNVIGAKLTLFGWVCVCVPVCVWTNIIHIWSFILTAHHHAPLIILFFNNRKHFMFFPFGSEDCTSTVSNFFLSFYTSKRLISV